MLHSSNKLCSERNFQRLTLFEFSNCQYYQGTEREENGVPLQLNRVIQFFQEDTRKVQGTDLFFPTIPTTNNISRNLCKHVM